MSLIEQFKEELAMLKKAPLTFMIGFVVLAALIYWGEYSFIFKEWIARKDSLIDTLEKQLITAKDQLQGAPKPLHTAPTTGTASSSGNNSPANTGNGNTFTNTQTTPKLRPPKYRQ